MAATENNALKKLRAGELCMGMVMRFARTGDAAKIAKASGHDWVHIDMEHSAMSMETAVELAVAALDTGITPIVRVPGHERWHASRVLDGGPTSTRRSRRSARSMPASFRRSATAR